ncbi:MAG: translocation/assembly module TamB domain-containing protein [Sulfuricurvum sp.]
MSFKRKRLKRGLKHLFVAIHALLIMGILLVSALFYLAFHPNGLTLLNTYILPALGIQTSSTEGSLTSGVILHNLHTETIDAKTLTLDYNLTAILNGKHIVDSITIDGLRIHLDDFIGDNDTPSFSLPTFVLKSVKLTKLQLISTYPIELNIDAQNGSFDGDKLNFKTLKATILSRYASGALSGHIKNNTITGAGVIYPNASQLDKYVAEFTTLPAAQRIEIIELSNSRVQLKTAIDQLGANFDPTLSLQNITLFMDYHYKNDYIDFDAAHTLIREEDRIQIAQKLRYNFNGTTTTALEGLIASSRPLPTKNITANFRDDAQGVAGKVILGGSDLSLQSSDYKEFAWHLNSHNPTLDFLPFLPEELKSSYLNATAHGSYTSSTKTITGTFSASHNHGDINGTLSIKNDDVRLNGKLLLSPDAPIWKEWKLKPPLRLDIEIARNATSTHINLSGDDLALSLEQTSERVKGAGSYLGTYFDLNGTVSDMKFTSVTPSLGKTLSLISSITLPDMEFYDAEIRTTTHIKTGTEINASMDIEIPWYAIVLDSRRQYSGTNNTLTLHYNDGNIVIDKYRFEVADHPIFSNHPSYLHIDPAGNLIVDEIRIFDELRLNGTIEPATLAANLNLKSERFSYNGPEGEAHIAADLRFTRDANASQNLEGSLTVLDGKITYLPFQQFKVMDDDIIIIQDIRPPSTSLLGMNIKITSTHPIEYKTKELDFKFIPDLTIWKDPLGPVQILGMITIPSGTATSNAKIFDIKRSEIYFAGNVPLNPYLNLTIEHEVDYKKIQIYINHTLDSPIFLFNSDPLMSQNDIMSYLLFGTPASAASSGGNSPTVRADATNFMLGAGLKGLIGGVTKIQLDTMNILTTKEGGMGFEVGTRLNKDFRILYKNDTISSVLIQYTVNRWLRLDADIHELGQGINAIYVKDFHDFLPHNPPKVNAK